MSYTIQRLLRRELSSLQPIHSAISLACLVSKHPSEASTSTEDRIVLKQDSAGHKKDVPPVQQSPALQKSTVTFHQPSSL
uniref:Uncharacterized protein n=1 Tax=Quercus lobata TaxID=97700 RepID=A0A7N2M3H1_QUELO